MGRWGEELPSLGELSIPRWHKPSKFGRISNAQLHYFLDASTQEYRQCSYLRLINDKVNIHCSFVINKARVAILKSIKVPRLEFTAAVTSCKTSAQLQRELEYERVEEVFLTDSKVFLVLFRMILDDFTSFFPTEFSKSENNRSQTSGIMWRLSEIWLIMPLEVSKPKEFRKQVALREQSFVGAKRELMETQNVPRPK